MLNSWAKKVTGGLMEVMAAYHWVYDLYYLQADCFVQWLASAVMLMSTLRWVFFAVLWIWFRHTGPVLLCIDLFLFICVYFVCFCFILHSCCNNVSAVRWTWWDWSLILRTYLPSVLWHCLLGRLTYKNPVPDMNYNVFGRTLNLA